MIFLFTFVTFNQQTADLPLLTDEFNESVLEKVNKLDDEDKNFTIYKKF